MRIQLLDRTYSPNYVAIVQTTYKKNRTMARKSKNGVNVSQAIRDYLNANAGVGPTEAAAEISKQVGKKVPPIYVSNVKNLMKGKSKKKGRRGRKPGSVAVASRAKANGSVDLGTLTAMKELVGRVGADTARQLIDLLT